MKGEGYKSVKEIMDTKKGGGELRYEKKWFPSYFIGFSLVSMTA
jgi:hypothetical protein